VIPVLEIGGTHVTAALVDPVAARAVARVREPLDAQGGREEILGGSMTGSWDLVGPALRAGLEPHLAPGRTSVRPGTLAEDAALTGAAAFAAAP